MSLFDKLRTPLVSPKVSIKRDGKSWYVPYSEKTKILLDNEWLLNMDNHFLSNVIVETKKKYHSPILSQFIANDMSTIKPMPQIPKENDLGWSLYKAKLVNLKDEYLLFVNDIEYVEGDKLTFPKAYGNPVVDNIKVNPINPFSKPILSHKPSPSSPEIKLLVGRYAKEFLQNEEEDTNSVDVYFTFITHTFSLNTGSFKLKGDILSLKNRDFKIVPTSVIAKHIPELYKDTNPLKVYSFMYSETEIVPNKHRTETYSQNFYLIDEYLYEIPSLQAKNHNLVYVDKERNEEYPVTKVKTNVTVYTKMDTDEVVAYNIKFNKRVKISKKVIEDGKQKSIRMTLTEGTFTKNVGDDTIDVRIDSIYNELDLYRVITADMMHPIEYEDDNVVHKYKYMYNSNVDVLIHKEEGYRICVVGYMDKSKGNKFFDVEFNENDNWLVVNKRIDSTLAGKFMIEKRYTDAKVFSSPTSRSLHLYIGEDKYNNDYFTSVETNDATSDDENIENVTKITETNTLEYVPYFYNLQSFVKPNTFSSIKLSCYHAFKVGKNIKIQYTGFGEPLDPTTSFNKLNFEYVETKSNLYNLLQVLNLSDNLSILFPSEDLNNQVIKSIDQSKMNPKYTTGLHDGIPEQALKFMPDEWELLAQTCIRCHNRLPIELLQTSMRFANFVTKKPYIEMFTDIDFDILEKEISSIYVDNNLE